MARKVILSLLGKINMAITSPEEKYNSKKGHIENIVTVIVLFYLHLDPFCRYCRFSIGRELESSHETEGLFPWQLVRLYPVSVFRACPIGPLDSPSLHGAQYIEFQQG